MAMKCRVVTPDKSYYDGDAIKVVVPAWDGEMAFFANHAPLIAKLGHGVMRIEPADRPGAVELLAIHEGFVKVKDNEVLVLAGGAETQDNIDKDEAKAALEAAQKAVTENRPPKISDEEFADLEKALVHAGVRYAVAHGSAPAISLPMSE